MRTTMCARNFLLMLLIVVVVENSNAQPWYKGTVTLTNSRVVSGELSYQPDTDVIFVKMGGKQSVMVFPAFRIESFVYYDKEAEVQRRFVPLRVKKGAALAYQFYEVVLEGPISVLRQQGEMWYSLKQPTIEYSYFVLAEGNLMAMNIFRREMYRSLRESSNSTREFVRKNRINPSNVDDTLAFIRFYNSEQAGIASAR